MAGNRILLVEADAAAAQQLSQALYGSGHHVQWVDNLAQAQAAVQVVSPDHDKGKRGRAEPPAGHPIPLCHNCHFLWIALATQAIHR
ncbi:hypothetical protein PSUB009319_00410 [Ralstonia sp. SET104]|nr:hypothetical protein PSUB009319_00410 [Ralstonia sp. SET104]